MKIVCLILLVLSLVFASGCSQKTPVEVMVPETTVPETTVSETTEATEATIPVPDVVEATAAVDGVPAILATLSRGDTVDVVDSFDEKHYVVKTDMGYGLLEKALIRMSDEAEYEAWTGYARYKAAFFDNFHLTGEPVKTLSSNTKVKVLADLGWCYVVEYEETIGYLAVDKVSRYPMTGGNGSSGGTGADGGDISLRYGEISLLSTLAPQQGEVTGQAAVLVDGAEIVLGYFNRDDKIPVVTEKGFGDEKEGFHLVYLEDLYAYVPEETVIMDGDNGYEEWDGYSKYKAVICEDMWLLGDASDRLNVNTVVRVLWELENCYYVEVDGVKGFMAKDMVNATRNPVGGSGSSGDSGGDWSVPML